MQETSRRFLLSGPMASRKALSRYLAVTFWLCFAAMIVFETLFFRPWMNSSEYIFSTALLLSILALGWVIADSREHGVETSKLLHLFVVIAAFLAVPYYRFRYFGARAGFIFLGILGLNFAGLFLLAYALDHMVTKTGLP
jgi:hypothetical protein